MKTAYAFIGMAFLVLAVVVYVLGTDITHPKDNSMALTLASSAFAENSLIPAEYTCDGTNLVPPLTISNVPNDAQSLVLIMDDPDIPESVKQSRGIDVFDHWVVFNIQPTTTNVREGVEPPGVLGNNGAGKSGYIGPCPPDKEHRYFFKLYALDTMITLKPGASKSEVEQAMAGHIIAQTQLVARYDRPR